MNIAYKHLDAKLRIAELSVGQWIGVLLGLAAGLCWGVYLSPFGSTLTVASAVYVAALPAGATLLGNLTEVSPSLLLRSAAAWRRREGRFVPGPGSVARGYVVSGETADERRPAPPTSGEADLASLWNPSR